MYKLQKRVFTIILALIMITSPIPTTSSNVTVVQAASVQISKKSITLNVGDTKPLRMLGTSSKVTWASSRKSVATVSSRGKVTAKRAGRATITATVNGAKYTCKVTIVDAVSSATQ